MITNKKETMMEVKITVQSKKEPDSRVTEQPGLITIGFSPERTKIYQQHGDEALLRSWCEQIVERNFPKEKFEILKIETCNQEHHKEVQQ